MTLQNFLTTLETSGLIRLAQLEPELEYLFRHALVQEAVYQSLLKSDRRILHGVVANALEDLFEDRVDEVAPLLALHCEEMGDDEKALHYFAISGDLMARVYANAEASLHYTRALEIAIKVGMEIETLQPLYISRGRVLELSGQYEEALENYSQLGSLARGIRDQSLLLQSLLARITIYSTPSVKYDREQALRLSEQALDLARDLDNPSAEAHLLWSMSLLNLYSDREHQQKAVTYGQRSVDIARAAGLEVQLTHSLTDLARAHVFLNNFFAAQSLLQEAFILWEKLENKPMMVDVIVQMANVFVLTGDYSTAQIRCDEAFALSRLSNNVWGQAVTGIVSSTLYLESGDMNSAIDVIEEAIRISPQAGYSSPSVAGRAILGMIYASLGAFEKGIEVCELAIRDAEQAPFWIPMVNAVQIKLYLQQNDRISAQAVARLKSFDINEILDQGVFPFDHVIIATVYSELALFQGEPEISLGVMNTMINKWKTHHIQYYLADMLYLKGKALYAQGKMQDAQISLQQAREQAEKLGVKRILWCILATMANIAEENGALIEAESLRQKSREIISLIASRCPADLQEIFLQMPEVQIAMRG